MNRRDFILLSAAVTLAMPAMAQAETAYMPDLLKAELAAGKTVFLDFKAVWCGTCMSQGRTIKALQAENADYEKNISFINVDWDEWGDSPIVTDLNIPRRSTLVVLKGDKELGRIVAGTAKSEIKALMDIALQAATGA